VIWTDLPLAVVLLVQVPLILIWLVVLVDLVRRPDLPVWRKLLWMVGCTILIPLLAVYLLVRPQRARGELAGPRSDPHSRLVEAVLDHEAGLLGEDRFGRIVGELRTGSRSSP
jgi:hypothetical protein